MISSKKWKTQMNEWTLSLQRISACGYMQLMSTRTEGTEDSNANWNITRKFITLHSNVDN